MTDRPELLRASDETIDDALRHADPMALRGLLFQLTGDESLAALPVATVSAGVAEARALADPAGAAVVRERAAAWLRSYRDGGAGEVPVGPADRLPHSLELTAGESIDAAEREVWLEELALDPWARSLRWRAQPPPERLGRFRVLVVGAGLGGLNAAVQLKRAGIPFAVVEKNSGVGGTWYENRYPGARVDSPSRTYTHLYGVDYRHPNPFCRQPENEKYFNWVADTFGIRDAISFDTEVRSMVWEEATATWAVTTRSPDGERVEHANVIISAVGFLSRPNTAELPGAETFAGPAFHTARWPRELDLSGKRVAVIGSGCTSYQMVPELADLTGHVTVFQRTPQWVFDRPGYREPFPEQVLWLERNLPYYSNFLRLRTSWLTGPHVQSRAFTIDPEWDDPLTRSALNARIRDGRLEHLRRKLGEHPELMAKMVPPHPPMSARPVAVDDRYSILDALLRDDVDLVTEPIRRVTPHGIETADGREHPADVLVHATGFKANDFLWPMEVRGRGGTRVEELWAHDGARAWAGTMLPGFPNFFMLYGPNTNPFSLGVVTFSELMTRFALERIEELLLTGRRAVEVTDAAYRRYNRELDAREALRTWSDPRATNYYRNAHGRSASNCPFEGTEIWQRLRHPDAADFVLA
ncbi:flavin-containing monooxygenase [Pseudonocardia kunmingensis]|uniref:4-hydroxyacetophenone monooxygenase n=1 Tax=Pseudonocardia kunmingensis TaxID=630975 RepID=A0A543DRH3_9PSEU|nr:NAD(P)/FAD-dependent oxidoreductase [Pseudonocardia kunmingensis]TQM11937.1 4-hydroxyacetophenone monooxygenase [Pseudonocardia kunmingensis]